MLGGEGRGVHHHIQHEPKEAVQEDREAKAREDCVHNWATEQLYLLVRLDSHVVRTQDGHEEELLHALLWEVLADLVDEGDGRLEAGLREVEEGH